MLDEILTFDLNIRHLLIRFLLKKDVYTTYVKCIIQLKNIYSWFEIKQPDSVFNVFGYWGLTDCFSDYYGLKNEWETELREYRKKNEKDLTLETPVTINGVLRDAFYDTESCKIKLTYVMPNGEENEIEIPVNHLTDNFLFR